MAKETKPKTKLPKVGDVVLFHPPGSDTVARSNSNDGPIAAIVTRVWNASTVNLKIVPDLGAVEDRSSVPHGEKEYNWSWK